MNRITLNVASRGLYVLNMFGTLIVSMILTFLTFEYFPIELNKLIFIGIFMGLWYLVSRLTKKIPMGQVNLEIANEGLKINWIHQFLLHNKRDELLRWNLIKDYMFQPEQHFNLFRIRTIDKRKLKFSMVDNNDEFPIFYESFEQLVNSKSENESANIVRAKNIYESNYGLISAFVLGIIMFGGVVVFLTVEPKGEPNYGILIASMVGGIFFIIQVINYRRKAKNR